MQAGGFQYFRKVAATTVFRLSRLIESFPALVSQNSEIATTLMRHSGPPSSSRRTNPNLNTNDCQCQLWNPDVHSTLLA